MFDWQCPAACPVVSSVVHRSVQEEVVVVEVAVQYKVVPTLLSPHTRRSTAGR